nr:hypothetical protein [Tanacetum cinerariifolium]
PVDAENWISHMEKIFDVMSCEDAFKTRLAMYKFEDFKKLFFLQFFPRAEQEPAGTEEEQAKNFQWGLRRDDDDAERPDKRRVVIGISRPLNRVVTGTTVIITTVMDQTGEVPSSPGVPLKATPTQFALRVDADTQESVVELLADKKPGALGRVFAITEDHATKTSGALEEGVSFHSSDKVVTGVTVRIATVTDLTGVVEMTTTAAATTATTLAVTTGSQRSRGPSEGYSYPVCTTCGRRHQGECRRAAGTCFKYGQAGHLQKDCRKNTTTNTSGQADKKPGASGCVFAITEGQAANTS